MKKPLLHFAPEKNWMNDPNGTIFVDGVYHVFYQYNPHGPSWGDIHWGHAVTKDLVNWKRRDIFLSPDKKDDEQHCFSGCTAKGKDGYKCFYTSIGFEIDAVQKHASQVIKDIDKDFNHVKGNSSVLTNDLNPYFISEWRDPFIFHHQNKTYLLLAGQANNLSSVYLYRTKDESLNDWEFLKPLYSVPINSDILECPNAVMFGNKMLLIYSSIHDNLIKYVSGDFIDESLIVKQKGIIDYGVNCYYASNIAIDKDNNVILFAWQRESLNNLASPDGLYSGCLALPRVITLNGYNPCIRFVDSLQSLNLEGLPIFKKDDKYYVKDCEQARITFNVKGEATLYFLTNAKEGVTLIFKENKLEIARKSLFNPSDLRLLSCPLLEKENHVEMIRDNTIIEMIINGDTALSFRFYNLEPIDKLLSFTSPNIKEIKVTKLKAPIIK